MARRFTKNVANYMQFPPGTFNRLLSGAAAISWSAWVRGNSFTIAADGDDLFTTFIGSGNATSLGLRLSRSSSIQFFVGARSTSADSFQTSSTLFYTALSTEAVNAWMHLGAVIDIAGDRIRLYVNGLKRTESVVSFGATTYTTSGTPTFADCIGCAVTAATNVPPSTTRQFDGTIGEMALWRMDIGDAGMRSSFSGIPANLIYPEDVIVMPMDGNSTKEELSGQIRSVARIFGSVPSISDSSPRREYVLPVMRAASLPYPPGPHIYTPSNVVSAGSWTAVGAPTLYEAVSDGSDATLMRSNTGTANDTVQLGFPETIITANSKVTFSIRHGVTP